MAALRDPECGCRGIANRTGGRLRRTRSRKPTNWRMRSSAATPGTCGRTRRPAVSGRVPGSHRRGRGLFDFDAVAAAISAKLERRHPHVFGAATVNSRRADGRVGRAQGGRAGGLPVEPLGTLDAFALGLPALTRAAKLAGGLRACASTGAGRRTCSARSRKNALSCETRLQRGTRRPSRRNSATAVQRRAVCPPCRTDPRRAALGQRQVRTPLPTHGGLACRAGSVTRDAGPEELEALWRGKQETG